MNKITRLLGVSALAGALFIGVGCEDTADDGDDGGVLDGSPTTTLPGDTDSDSGSGTGGSDSGDLTVSPTPSS